MENKEFYSLNDVAKILDLSYQTVLSLVKKGYLVAAKYGSQWRISRNELKRFKNEGNLSETVNLVSIEEDEPVELS